MSGGPTVSMDGKVIGVNSFKIAGETQPFNFVQPSGTLQELMRSEAVENSPGRVSDLYRDGLAAYFAGDRNAAIESFDQVLAIVPNHRFAQEYKRKAQDLPVSAFSLGSPVVKIGLAVVIIVGLLVVAAVIILVVWRVKKDPKPTPIPPAMTGPPYVAPPASIPPMAMGRSRGRRTRCSGARRWSQKPGPKFAGLASGFDIQSGGKSISGGFAEQRFTRRRVSCLSRASAVP